MGEAKRRRQAIERGEPDPVPQNRGLRRMPACSWHHGKFTPTCGRHDRRAGYVLDGRKERAELRKRQTADAKRGLVGSARG